jgi:hypothetical protein
MPCLGVAAVLLFASAAFGDGCYIPERAVRKIPEIPAQRALLSWKDGVETLVISSALDSEAQKLGWIIPLPAVPQTIEKESPGGLKTLSFCIQPKITHDLYLGVKALVVCALIANLIMATFLFKRERFLDVLLLIVILVVLWSLLLPALGGAGGVTTTANTLVEKTAAVGSYQVSVLRPKTLDDLNAWLAENGFSALPTEADATIADYISKGWVFAAIKLTRAESGANAPHPIRMAFPAKGAVYPLRLTALAGGSTEFEVFVVAKDTASCDLLKEEFCDRFSKLSNQKSEGYETGDECLAKTSNCAIGHSAICSLMWNDCVLTKFAGTIKAADMTQDIRFQWRPFRAFRQHFYTANGARDVAVILFVFLAGGWLFVSMIVFSTRIKQPGGRRWYFGKMLLPAIVLFSVGAAIVFACLPKLAASEVAVHPWRQQFHFPFSFRAEIEFVLKDHEDVLRGTDQEIAAALLQRLTDERNERPQNTIAGTDLKVEDCPGNFTVESHGKKVLIRIYDRYGRALLIEETVPDRAEKRAGQGGG